MSYMIVYEFDNGSSEEHIYYKRFYHLIDAVHTAIDIYTAEDIWRVKVFTVTEDGERDKCIIRMVQPTA